MTAAERMTQALIELADRDKSTPCQARRSERWTSDNYDDLTWAAFHCVSLACPLLDLCHDAAEEQRIKHFTWGGRVRSPKPTRRKAA